MSKTKLAFLTGGSGYIGRHVVSLLLNNGWKVALVSRPSTDLSFFIPWGSNLEIFEDDGTVNFIDRAIKSALPDLVIHMAAVARPENTPDAINEMIDANLLLGVQILESMHKHGCKKFINTGTYWKRSSSQTPDPMNLYATTKLAFETFIDFYVTSSEIQAVTLNLADVYGPNDFRPKLLTLLFNALQGGEAVDLTPGHQLINLCHVDDVARAFLIAAEQVMDSFDPGHAEYAIAADKQLSIRDLVATIENVSGRKIPVVFGAKAYRKREIMVPWFGKRLPQWRQEVSLESGLSEIFS
jgi:nucleoside-diphosphate-sugar epimerase